MTFKKVVTLAAVILFFTITVGNTTTAVAAKPEGLKSIIDLVIENGHFNKLVEALNDTGIAEMLSSGQEFTVFAPVDDAFTKMTPDQINALLNDRDELKKVLLYHLAMGEKLISELKCGQHVETLLGKTVKITKDGKDVQIGDANVLQEDLLGSNGVLQIIDRVNIPSDRKSYKEPMKDCN